MAQKKRTERICNFICSSTPNFARRKWISGQLRNEMKVNQ